VVRDGKHRWRDQREVEELMNMAARCTRPEPPHDEGDHEELGGAEVPERSERIGETGSGGSRRRLETVDLYAALGRQVPRGLDSPTNCAGT
jgi:hypothetical protein